MVGNASPTKQYVKEGSRIRKSHAKIQRECVAHSKNQKKHSVAGNQAGVGEEGEMET